MYICFIYFYENEDDDMTKRREYKDYIKKYRRLSKYPDSGDEKIVIITEEGLQLTHII